MAVASNNNQPDLENPSDNENNEQDRQLLSLQASFLIKVLKRPYNDNFDSVEDEYIKPIFEFDENDTNEVLIKKKELQDEIVSIIKEFPWPYSKKLEVLELHTNYVKQQTGRHSSGRLSSYQYSKGFGKRIGRYLGNLLFGYRIWSNRIKTVECFFGSVVASYFIFLRGMFFLNLILSLLFTGFVVLPKLLLFSETVRNVTGRTDTITNVLNFQGPIRDSVLFFGYYTQNPISNLLKYNLPLAYFLTVTGAYIFSYAFILFRISRSRKKTTKISIVSSTNFNFTWKLCTNWDFLINNEGNAISKKQSIRTEFAELIGDLRDVRRQQNYGIFIKYARRITAWFLVIATWFGCGTLIFFTLIQYECDLKDSPNIIVRYLVSIVLALCNAISPVLFDIYSNLEDYKQQTKLKLKIFRVMIMYLFNLSVLVLSIVSVTPFSATFALRNYFSPSNDTSCRLAARTSVGQCWESTVGQELFKVSTIDLISVVSGVIIGDFLRSGLVRCLPACRTKDEPPYPTFAVAQSILQIVYSEGLTWLGMFFSPFLPVLALFKTFTLFYLKNWSVMTNTVLPKEVFSATSTLGTYYLISLVMLFITTISYGIIIANFALSTDCGPFQELIRNHTRITGSNSTTALNLVVETYIKKIDNTVVGFLYDQIISAHVIIPVIILLSLAIAYFKSLSANYKDLSNDLRVELYQAKETMRRLLPHIAREPTHPAPINRSQGLRQRVVPQRSSHNPVNSGNSTAAIATPSTSQQSSVPTPHDYVAVENTVVSPQNSSTYTHETNQNQQITPTSSNLQPAAKNNERNTASQPNKASSSTTPNTANPPTQPSEPNTSSASNSQATEDSRPKVTINLKDIMNRIKENPDSVSDREKQRVLSALPENRRAEVKKMLYTDN